MARRTILMCAVAALAFGGCNKAPPAPRKDGDGKAVNTDAIRGAATDAGVTPMGERVAVLGFLNKRNGIVQDLQLRPGQAIRVRDAVVRLRACETSAPWENVPLTGAFVQLDVEGTDGNWRRAFSGWLYKESPSLNVVEHAVYDVWPKSCAMTFPGGTEAPASPRSTNSASSAKKSGAGSRRASPTPPTATEGGGSATVSTPPPPPPEPLVAVPNATPSNST